MHTIALHVNVLTQMAFLMMIMKILNVLEHARSQDIEAMANAMTITITVVVIGMVETVVGTVLIWPIALNVNVLIPTSRMGKNYIALEHVVPPLIKVSVNCQISV